MGIAELLTIIFVVLKLIGSIEWAWWQVLLPTIISVPIYILVWTVAATMAVKQKKKFDREFDNFFK